jgi:nitrogen-specific signal transduction histidine kinase
MRLPALALSLSIALLILAPISASTRPARAIPDELKPRLFEPYFSTKTEGTGLGLAICKKIVEDQGGSIRIDSRAGEGTTVTVQLPVVAGTTEGERG